MATFPLSRASERPVRKVLAFLIRAKMSLMLSSLLLLPTFHADVLLGTAVFGGFEGESQHSYPNRSVEGGQEPGSR